MMKSITMTSMKKEIVKRRIEQKKVNSDYEIDTTFSP